MKIHFILSASLLFLREIMINLRESSLFYSLKTIVTTVFFWIFFIFSVPLTSKIFEKITGTSQKIPHTTKKTTNRLSQRFVALLVRSRELESLALWLKEPTGQNTLILEVSSLRHFCAKHRDFLPGNFCTLCRILQVRVPIASLETVQKQCRNRALTLGQMKNDDFWSMTWWRFEWPQRWIWYTQRRMPTRLRSSQGVGSSA